MRLDATRDGDRDLSPRLTHLPPPGTMPSSRTLHRLALTAVVFLAPAPGAQQTGGSTPAEAAVRATVQAVFRAVETGDLAALDTLYAGEDLTVVEGAGINRGWADYRDNHLAPELDHFENFRYRPRDIQVHVAGELAWVMFDYSIRGRSQGREIDNFGRGTMILERRSDRWVVRHSQTTSRPRRSDDPR